jgi:ElaB/YqjD/DUF883 family membrane-anchored ribosome-binding protein
MTIEQTRDQIVDQFSSVLSEAENLLSKATHETGEKAKDLRSQAEARLLTAKLAAAVGFVAGLLMNRR